MSDPWVAAHVALHEQGLNRVGREADAAAYCRQQAQTAPVADRPFWLAEATQYEHWAALREHGTTGMPEAGPLMYAGVPMPHTDDDTAWLEDEEA